MAMTNHFENHIGLSNITEIKRETGLTEKIVELRTSEQGFWRCLCIINATITKSILLPRHYYYQYYQYYYQRQQNTKELMTQSFTALPFRDNSNESHG